MLHAEPGTGTRRVLAGTEAQSSVAMSGMLFERSPAAVVFTRQAETGLDLTDADLAAATSAAVGLQIPLLVIGPGGSNGAEVGAELDRLGVETVIGYGDPTAEWAAVAGPRALVVGPTAAADFEAVLGLSATPETVPAADVVASIGDLDAGHPRLLTLESAPAAGPSATGATPGAVTIPSSGSALTDTATGARIPPFTPPARPVDALVLATPTSALGPLATARAAGADVELAADADPRATVSTVDAVRSHADDAVVAIGVPFGAEETFAQRVQVAATAPQLPGGGQTVFPGRRMVALYGHTSGPALGALGEQGIDETITRVKDLAARYQPFSDEPVVPALDLIATVASAEPGNDGDYSRETPVEDLRPWVDAAEEQGVYVVLDLQSGRSDFLSQARLYEELLARPSVGLALDPEWRLAPGQVPLRQVGTVDAAEINTTTAWLADLTRDRALPQKLVMVHQFRVDMLSGREDLDMSRGELALTLHADGHGTPGEKLETWSALQGVSPAGVWPSWKNFYDEDQPMLTPEQTYSLVDPKPWLVTYQ
ncbi:hypothetical protein [Arthrobacter sp. TMS1-12-1]